MCLLTKGHSEINSQKQDIIAALQMPTVQIHHKYAAQIKRKNLYNRRRVGGVGRGIQWPIPD